MADGSDTIREATAADVPLLPFPRAQELERALLNRIVQRGFGCDWSVWRTYRSLIAPSLAANAAGFSAAAREMTARGWPVYIRDTGGDITPQSPGVVNVSSAFVFPQTSEMSIRATYEQFCAPLLAFFDTLGFKSYLSSVEGSFCDGAFNIVVDGRKLAGTAQRWRLVRLPDGRPGVAVLAHAAILADADIATGVAETNLFYRLCGVDRVVDPARHISTAALSGRQLAALPLAVRIARFLAKWH